MTLGLALPWREAALERYKMSHSYYGDLQGGFDGRGLDFFKSAWHLWLAAPFAMVLFPLFPFVYARFKAAEWRWWLSGIHFGDVRLQSDLPENALQGVYWKVIGWYFLAAIVLTIVGFVFTDTGGAASPTKSIPLLLLPVIVYLILILSINVAIRVYLVRDVWAKVLESVRVLDIAAAADVAAKGDLASALGEGFADGLDVAGF
jgi:hypothetical protein